MIYLPKGFAQQGSSGSLLSHPPACLWQSAYKWHGLNLISVNESELPLVVIIMSKTVSQKYLVWLLQLQWSKSKI